MKTNLNSFKEIYNFKKISIIGCPGSGKSTLSVQLAKILNLEAIHLDKIYWKPYWVNISKEEFDEKHDEILKKESFILDGNYNRTISKRLEKCDLVIYLDYDSQVCIDSYIQRVKDGSIKDFITENCVETLDEDFNNYISSYNEKNRENNYKKIYDSNIKYIILNNRDEKDEFINSIRR